MNVPFPRLALAASIAALAFASGCNKEKAPVTGTTASTGGGTSGDKLLDPDKVVAEINGEKVTEGQLEIKPQLQQLHDQYEKQQFDLKKQAVDAYVADKLTKKEAEKRGMSVDDLFKAEVDNKIPKPSDEEVKKLYDQAAGRLPPGATLETYRGQIEEFLGRSKKQELARAFYDRLKAENKVKILISEPRKQVAATGPSKGPDGAKVTIVEFSDFECPFCSRAEDTVKQVMDTYAGKVKLVFRHYPLPFHPHAQKAAEASACADEQGKFWPMHETLFSNQKALEVDKLKQYAQQIGLDTAKFNDCLDNGKKADLVKKDSEAGSAVGVNGTPAFFINGIMISGAQPFDEFKRVIDGELSST